jgi:hypothetical protein
MKRLNGLSAAVVCLGLTAACGGGDREAGSVERDGTAGVNTQVETEESTGRPVPTTVTGCLSSADGRYVLTALKAIDDGPGGPTQATTETYQLTNADEQLRQHVGRHVRVNGEAEPARVADVRETSPSAPAARGTSGQQSANQPAVSTETRTRLEMRRMSVTSVSATGENCPTEPGAASSR